LTFSVQAKSSIAGITGFTVRQLHLEESVAFDGNVQLALRVFKGALHKLPGRSDDAFAVAELPARR
jgi:hypothetical protein